MKKQSKSLIAAGVGVCLISSAALANYSTGNGYDALKKGAWGLVESDNFTLDIDASLTIDENNVANSKEHMEYDGANKLSYSKGNSYVNGAGKKTSEIWESADKSVYYSPYSWSARNEQTKHYSVYQYEHEFGTPLEMMTGETEQGRKILNFVEALADTVVGDLRNNFVYAGNEDGANCYQINLSAVQIPELISSGLSAITAVEKSYVADDAEFEEFDGTNLDSVMATLRDVNIDSVNGRVLINEDGTLRGANGDVCFVGYDKHGSEHSIVIGLGISVSDYGTTAPKTIDVSALDQNDVDYY